MTDKTPSQTDNIPEMPPVRRGGLLGVMRDLTLASLGVAGVVVDEAQALYRRSVEHGDELIRQLQRQARVNRRPGVQKPQVAKIVQDEWAAQFARLGLPSRSEVEALTKQIGLLEEEVDRLSQNRAAGEVVGDEAKTA
jgi:polyhydroxyalkanoate synthesis regulator phasin